MSRREIGYRWHLRTVMADRGMFATTDLLAPLAERGIELSAAQVYRLVTGTPERLNLHVLAAVCDILGTTPGELIEPVVEATDRKRRVASDQTPDHGVRRPRRARITDDR